jgi:hypothetical protein
MNDESYRVRFIDPADAAELTNLYHLARTALAGLRHANRYDRMQWAARAYANDHPGVRPTGAYKDLEGLLR